MLVFCKHTKKCTDLMTQVPKYIIDGKKPQRNISYFPYGLQSGNIKFERQSYHKYLHPDPSIPHCLLLQVQLQAQCRASYLYTVWPCEYQHHLLCSGIIVSTQGPNFKDESREGRKDTKPLSTEYLMARSFPWKERKAPTLEKPSHARTPGRHCRTRRY